MDRRFKTIDEKEMKYCVFGRLTVLGSIGRDKYSKTLWLCKCECGNLHKTRGDVLRNGQAQSCGCYAKEIISQRHKTHGLSKTRLYNIWILMVDRCYNVNNVGYDDYGGRKENPVRVCDEWRCDVVVFYNWAVTHGYQNNLTINRIDNNGNYEPGNCNWITMEEQNQNQTTTKIKSEQVPLIRDDTRTDSKIAAHYGVDQSTISRIRTRRTWKNIA